MEIKNEKGEIFEYEVYVRNLQNQKVFSKYFNGYYEVAKFLQRCKYSKKVKALYVLNDYGYTIEDFLYR